MTIVTTSDRPDLDGAAMEPLRRGWPTFVLHDQVSNAHRRAVRTYFPQWDVLLLDGNDVLARATVVALRWDGALATLPAGYDGALVAAVTEHENGIEPDTLCLVAATVRPDRTGAGLAGTVLTALRDRAADAGLHRVIVPVRPTLKARFPQTGRYVVPGGLDLVDIDRERDLGTYHETNLWMRHR